MELIVIAVAALLTAILSAIAGLGGGVILLLVIAQFHAPVVAIPIQGGIQLVSNSVRAGLLRTNINWKAVGRAALLMLPATLVGVKVATAMPEDATRIVLGVFVLILGWRPALLKWKGRDELPVNAMIPVGAASGFLNATVGASGFVTSPFFRAVTAAHAGYVATAAASQTMGHLFKLLAFGLDGFAFSDHIDVMIVGAGGVMAGTWIGTRLMGRISEEQLALLFKVVLTALAIRLIIRALI